MRQRQKKEGEKLALLNKSPLLDICRQVIIIIPVPPLKKIIFTYTCMHTYIYIHIYTHASIFENLKTNYWKNQEDGQEKITNRKRLTVLCTLYSNYDCCMYETV